MDYLLNLVTKSNKDKGIDELFYLLSAFSLKDGLRKIIGENDVVYLHNVVVQNRVLDMYVLHNFPFHPNQITPPITNKGEIWLDTIVDHKNTQKKQ